MGIGVPSLAEILNLATVFKHYLSVFNCNCAFTFFSWEVSNYEYIFIYLTHNKK